MKNIKPVLFSFLIAIILIPQITFASWWNPFSWFKKKIEAPQITQVVPKTEELTSEQKIKDILYEDFLKEQANKSEKPKTDIYKDIPVNIPKTQVAKNPVVTPVIIKNNDKQCSDLKSEFYNFSFKWQQIDPFNEKSITKSLSNNLSTDFGLSSSMSDASSYFDKAYDKYLREKGSYYSKIENLRLTGLDLSLKSFGGVEVENIKTRVNKGLDLYKEAFDLKLSAFRLVIVESNLDDSRSKALQGTETAFNALNYFWSANNEYLKIKSAYGDLLVKLECK